MVLNRKKFRSNSLSRKKILLISLLSILLVYGVSLLLVSIFSMASPYRVEQLAYDFTVKENIGITLDNDFLHFGGGPNGAVLERPMVIYSDKSARVSISWEGPGDLSVSENNFEIFENLNKSVIFYLTIPADLNYGTYSGNISFNFFN